MLQFFRHTRCQKAFSLVGIFAVLSGIIYPGTAHALTSGPTTPEVSSFTPVGTSELVNVGSGEFTYNIPLMDVEGYPINIAYNSGIGMDQEASCVGLGWNLNVGTLNRTMRGLPDDFKGDTVKRAMNTRPNWTVGLKPALMIELFGFDPSNPDLGKIKKFIGKLKGGNSKNTKIGIGVSYNNYKGWGYEVNFNSGMSVGLKGASAMNLSLGLDVGQQGVSIQPSVNLQYQYAEMFRGVRVGASLSGNYNSQVGLKSLSLGLNRSIWAYGRTANGNTTLTVQTVSPTFVPHQDMRYTNFAFQAQFRTGLSFWGMDPLLDVEGYFQESKLADNEQATPAYGYLYQHEAAGSSSMYDFNRERDGAFMPKVTPFLPVPAYTYDIYSASGHGVGGTFRARRNDIGVVSDPYVFSNSGDGSAGVDLAPGSGKIGVTISGSITTTTSGGWISGGMANKAKFGQHTPYFKAVSEQTYDNEPNYWETIHDAEPTRVPLGGVDDAKDYFSPQAAATPRFARETKARMNQHFSFLTYREKQNLGANLVENYHEEAFPYPSLPLATMNAPTDWDGLFLSGGYDPYSRGAGRQDHHIAEATVTNTDGSRYVYGIAAYNTEQKEVSFTPRASYQAKFQRYYAGQATSAEQTEVQWGRVGYEVGDDNSKASTATIEQSKDQFYDATSLPPYAYAYHLTAVLSPDYLDMDAIPGPSHGDAGSWHKINYTRKHANYQWRAPINAANFSEGLMSDGMDGKASYLYGKKEIWMVHSVVSPNYVAEFYYSDRRDALGVLGENGGLDTLQRLQKLDSIRLFSIWDKLKNGDDAVPVKSVHLEYNYSLCPNVENHVTGATTNNGKLTLKKVWFKHGKSVRGFMSPYRFEYSSKNPKYHPKYTDRWGTYQQPDSTTSLTNADYPYVNQAYANAGATGTDPRRKADDHAEAWHLTKIMTPSGGQIEVAYEAHDYAYVMDHLASQMVKIIEIRKDVNTATGSGVLYDKNGSTWENRNVVVLDLPVAVTDKDDFHYRYLRGYVESGGENLVYFSAEMSLLTNSVKERVYGYVKVKDYGIISDGSGTSRKGYLVLEEEPIKGEGEISNNSEKNLQPMAMAGLHFMRLNTPQYVFPGSDMNASQGHVEKIKSLVGPFTQVGDMVKGLYRSMRSKRFAQKITVDTSSITSKSWMRLNNPDGFKHGGGTRVKQVSVTDNWNALSGSGQNKVYGQRYTYQTVDDAGHTISSGVASYEPLIGGDEIALKKPVYADKKVLLAPDYQYLYEEPIGEGLFPAPSIAYSKVTVRNLEEVGYARTGTGFIEHEFYTAKDFPTRIEMTNMETRQLRTGILAGLVPLLPNLQLYTVSQGFKIARNDMHGRPRAVREFSATNSDAPRTESVYDYRLKDGAVYKASFAGPHSRWASVTYNLDNDNVPVIGTDGQRIMGTVGVETDMIVDNREFDTKTHGIQFQLNIETLPPIAIVPTAIPWPTSQQLRLRMIATTKILDISGILDHVTVTEEGARVVTQNLAWDQNTAQVLYTQTTNEFRDPIYSFTYPAYWAYPEMGAAYQSYRTSWDPSLAYPANVYPGDMVMVYDDAGNPLEAHWVQDDLYNPIDLCPTTPHPLKLINKSGAILNPTPGYKAIVIRPAYRNMQMMGMGGITSMGDVFAGNQLSPDATDKIVDASAIQYTPFRQYASRGQTPPTTFPNIFVSGMLNSHTPFATWAYLTSRTSAAAQAVDGANPVNATLPNTRTDGVYEMFAPFWAKVCTADVWTISSDVRNSTQPANNRWQWKNYVSILTDRGLPLEEVDPLGNYSAVVYNAGTRMPVAVAKNARNRDIFSDDFEAHNKAYNDSRHEHGEFSFTPQIATISDSVYHSGKSSLLLKKGKLFYGIIPSFEIMKNDSNVKYYTKVTLPPSSSVNPSFPPLQPPYNSSYQPIPASTTVGFQPDTGSRKYVVSFWVALHDHLVLRKAINLANYGSATVKFFRPGSNASPAVASAVELLPASVTRSKVINGWQRVECILDIPGSTTELLIYPFSYLFSAGKYTSQATFFDDFRMHPVDANMNTFVYDYTNLRLLAKGDENNFFTFYQYDAEGRLVSTKVETSQGVLSNQEARYNSSTHSSSSN